MTITCPVHTTHDTNSRDSSLLQDSLATRLDCLLSDNDRLKTERLHNNSKDTGRARWPTARHAIWA